MPESVITIGIAPEIHFGPVTLAWHGITIAIGIFVGALAARRYARERGLAVDPLVNVTLLLAVGGIVGGKLAYVLEHGDVGALVSNRGFTFNGGFVLAAVLIGVYVKRHGLTARYLDAVATGLPLGVAIGRIGDIINGEHYGPRSDALLAVRNSNPDALTPNPALSYHNGGLYEVLIATVAFAVLWPLRHRLRRPGSAVWLVIVLFAVGRFVEFFYRADSPIVALGLDEAQWTSVVLIVVAAIGALLSARRYSATG